MNSTKIFIDTYEKLSPENQHYILGVLQSLKYAQDILDNHQCVFSKKQQADLTSIDKTTIREANHIYQETS